MLLPCRRGFQDGELLSLALLRPQRVKVCLKQTLSSQEASLHSLFQQLAKSQTTVPVSERMLTD